MKKMNQKNNIRYEGKVKVTIKNGKNIVSSKVYHNAGGLKLFEFLADSLGGIYNDKQRPTHIKLFTTTETSFETAIINDYSTSVCAGIKYNEITTSYTEDDKLERNICLHFIIPCSFLNLSSGEIEIKQAGLYCLNCADDNNKKNYSACFNFLNEDGTAWAPIVVSSSIGDYNIFVEWTLTLK